VSLVAVRNEISNRTNGGSIIVYIAGPYTGDVVENVRNAVHAAEQVIEMGYVPYIPHLSMLWHLIAPHPVEFWYKYDLKFLAKCDCLLRLVGESTGADNEVEFAKKNGIPVYYSISELVMGYKK